MNGRAADSESRWLARRLAEAERELAAERDRSRLLGLLNAALAETALMRSADEVVKAALRTIRAPLGFGRGIFVSVAREEGVLGSFVSDGFDVDPRPCAAAEVRLSAATLRIVRGDEREQVGLAGDLTTPLVDVRNWYAMSAVGRRDGLFGLLYADGHRSTTPGTWDPALLRGVATLAAVAIDNAILLAKTSALASADPLTGLLNRRAFSDRLQTELAACTRASRTLTYLILDVDDFKTVNDTRGHVHGDAVLRLVADTLVSSSRSGDVIGRYAGDEFTALLVNTEPDGARAHVARISGELQHAGLRCSIGASIFPRDGLTAAELLVAADRALYRTKAAGKNGFSFA